jgi:hypothetical protein
LVSQDGTSYVYDGNPFIIIEFLSAVKPGIQTELWLFGNQTGIQKA